MATMRGSLGRDGVGSMGGGGSVVPGGKVAGASAGRSMRSDMGVGLGLGGMVLSNEVESLVVAGRAVVVGRVVVPFIAVVVLHTASASTVQLALAPEQLVHARAQMPSGHHDSPATHRLHDRVEALEHMGYKYSPLGHGSQARAHTVAGNSRSHTFMGGVLLTFI